MHKRQRVKIEALIKKNDGILKTILKTKTKSKKMPASILKNYNIINRQFDKIIKKKKEKQESLENKYKFITRVNIKDIHKYQCAALKRDFYRCAQRVAFLHKNINVRQEKKKYKKNVPFCKKHIKLLLNSQNKKILENGFFFESDLYSKSYSESE